MTTTPAVAPLSADGLKSILDKMEVIAQVIEGERLPNTAKALSGLIAQARAARPATGNDMRAGMEAAAKALTERAGGHYRNGDHELQDECLQCAAMIRDMKPTTTPQSQVATYTAGVDVAKQDDPAVSAVSRDLKAKKQAAMAAGSCKAESLLELCLECCNSGRSGCAALAQQAAAHPAPAAQAPDGSKCPSSGRQCGTDDCCANYVEAPAAQAVDTSKWRVESNYAPQAAAPAGDAEDARRLDKFIDWYLNSKRFADIDPWGHVRFTTREHILNWLDGGSNDLPAMSANRTEED